MAQGQLNEDHPVFLPVHPTVAGTAGSFLRAFRGMKSLRIVLLCAALIGLPAAWLLPNFFHMKPSPNRCKNNLKNFGTALEMWNQDHGGYPDSVQFLTPTYLKTLPSCPNAQEYSYSYIKSDRHYTIVCQGTNHRAYGIPANYPQFTSLRGLIER